ncbi:MAG: hypothetical protein ACQESC_00445 [Nanobdellota archaeon]
MDMISKQENIAVKAFKQLGVDKNMPLMSVSFSKRFKGYNANVRMKRNKECLEFNLSYLFKECEEDIIIGAIQHLINKVYKTTIPTLEQELYESFLKNVNRYISSQESDDLLEELFEELKKEYFNNLLDKPTMIFGRKNSTVLGHYNYTTNTITISTILREDRNLLKYVLYHELLHKKHSFKTTNNRNQYHTKAFRDDERLFEDKDVEQKLSRFLKKRKLKKMFFKKR